MNMTGSQISMESAFAEAAEHAATLARGPRATYIRPTSATRVHNTPGGKALQRRGRRRQQLVEGRRLKRLVDAAVDVGGGAGGARSLHLGVRQRLDRLGEAVVLPLGQVLDGLDAELCAQERGARVGGRVSVVCSDDAWRRRRRPQLSESVLRNSTPPQICSTNPRTARPNKTHSQTSRRRRPP